MVEFQVEEMFWESGNSSLTLNHNFLVGVLVCVENKLHKAFTFHLSSERKTYNNTLSFSHPRSIFPLASHFRTKSIIYRIPLSHICFASRLSLLHSPPSLPSLGLRLCSDFLCLPWTPSSYVWASPIPPKTSRKSSLTCPYPSRV